MLANYHTHTKRCGHAEGEDRAYVENAIRNGMKVLGFADHCPWVYPDGFVSGTRMHPSELDDYFTSLTNLREEYKKDITVYIGFESEYIPELLPEQDKLLADYPVDYHILGQHFLTREPSFYTGRVFDNEKILEDYVDSVIEGMETGRYAYLAHPDLVGFSGSREIYDKHYRRLCEYLKEHDQPVEINLLGVVEHRHYTNEHFLKLAGETGCKAIIGCDAHQPHRLDYRTGQELCYELARRNNLPVIDYLPALGKKI
ncbi:MAG: histidinol-phosphatase [Oscillospiraceae bacterium]|nr:histidinol-phosphatase [Oscillospiraceae bacterium]